MTEPTNPEAVDIEQIMQQIRQQILAKKDAVRASGAPVVSVSGERFSAEFYDHLYQANLIYDQIGVKLFVSKSTLPLVGPIIDKVRYKLHELVLFYVNKMAAEQIQFNTHMLQTVNLLAQELEKETHA